MNFHKTIGYLAALLLMVGFGVPDSFAQAEVKTITLSINKSTLRDSTTTPVTVTATVGVTMTEAVTVETTVQVEVSVSVDDSYAAPTITIPVTIVADADRKAGTQGSLIFNMTATTASRLGDADTVDEKVTVTAQEQGETDPTDPKATRTITVTDHAARIAERCSNASRYPCYHHGTS